MTKLRILGISLIFLVAFLAGCSKPEEPKKSEGLEKIKLTEPKEEKAESEMECPPGAVALVDDRVITRDDAEKRARMTLRTKGFDESSPDFEAQLAKARKGAVDLLIETYVLQMAATDTIEVSTEEIEDELLRLKSRHKDRESYEEGLRLSNLTEDELKEILKKDLQIRKVLSHEAQKGVPIPTKEDARKFYEINSMAFGWPYRVRFDEILWPISPDVSDASREQAKAAMEKLSEDLRNTPDLFNQVLINSVSTTWGYIGLRNPFQTVDHLNESIQEALQSLVVDEISNPIETPIGFAIIRITGTHESYESAEQEILQSIYDDAVARNLEDWKSRQRKKHRVRICDLDYYEGESASDQGGEDQ